MSSANISRRLSILRLGSQIRFSGCEIDRRRKVLMDDDPFTFDFAIGVCGTHRHFQLVALGVGAHEMLDTVAERELAVGRDIEVANFKLR